MKVEMLKQTNFRGLKEVGQEYDMDETVARRWIKRGIACAVAGEENVGDGKEKDNGGDAGDDGGKSKYAGMKPKELYEECKARGIEAEAKKPAEYYVELFELDDATKAGGDNGDGNQE